MVKSVSWPTAEITGTGDAAMARATASSLNVHRSSSDPPPRPTITTSAQSPRAEISQAAADFLDRALALHQRREQPDVQPRKAARQDVDHVGITAPRGEVTRPMRRGKRGRGRLRGGVEQAFGVELFLQLLKGQLQRAEALRLERLHQKLIFAARFKDVDLAARQHGHAILRTKLEEPERAAEAHRAHLGLGVLSAKNMRGRWERA